MGTTTSMTGPIDKDAVRAVASAERGADWAAAGPRELSGAKGGRALTDALHSEVAAAPKRKGRS